MNFFITGATGQYGGKVVKHLIERGVSPQEITASGRNRERLERLASQYGVATAVVDNGDAEALNKALAGADRVLLVSGTQFGDRARQHRNVIDAAKSAGAALIAYTSVQKADDSPLAVAVDHRDTEQALKESGIPYAILRNAWYTENFLPEVEQGKETGVIENAAGDGVITAASREDLAEAAAVVLTSDGYENMVLELGGDESFTYTDLARAASTVLGREIVYRNVSPQQLAEDLKNAGVPQQGIDWTVKLAQDTAVGALGGPTGVLSKIIGHPTSRLEQVLEASLTNRE